MLRGKKIWENSDNHQPSESLFCVGRNGLVLWAREEGSEGSEQGSKRRRLRADSFCPKAQPSGGETSPAANRAASVVMGFLKSGRLVHESTQLILM